MPAATDIEGKQRRRLSDLGIRAASGLLLITIAILTTVIGGPVFIIAWLANAVAVLWEWQRLVDGPFVSAQVLCGSVALAAAGVLARSGTGYGFLVILGAGALLGWLAGPGRRVWACAGMVYAGLLILSVVALRFSFPFGSRSLIWLFATVWSADVFAYFGGRLLGGPKLWPRISPSKTWAGTLCGLAAAAAIGTCTAMGDLQAPSAVVPVLLLTLATAAVSQGGDIFESAIKRRFDVKDSSRLIPGHGGVMDRLDGFIAAAIFAFLFGLARNHPSVAGGLFFWV